MDSTIHSKLYITTEPNITLIWRQIVRKLLENYCCDIDVKFYHVHQLSVNESHFSLSLPFFFAKVEHITRHIYDDTMNSNMNATFKYSENLFMRFCH